MERGEQGNKTTLQVALIIANFWLIVLLLILVLR